MNDTDRDPEDLAAIQHTDRILDEIARGGNPVGHEEPIPTLVGWRREIDAEPGPELVGTATALEAIRAGRMPWRYRVMARIFRWMRGVG